MAQAPTLRIDPQEFQEARHRAGLSLSDVAELCGVTVRTAKNWEAGKTQIPLAAYRLIERGRLWDGWRISGPWLITDHGSRCHMDDIRSIHWLKQLAALARSSRAKPPEPVQLALPGIEPAWKTLGK